MNMISRTQADEYADWFRCLSDATRLQVLNFVAAVARPVTVGEIVDNIGRSQSTVSRHLRILADDEFVFAEPDGIHTMIRINQGCMTALPAAAAAIMATSYEPD